MRRSSSRYAGSGPVGPPIRSFVVRSGGSPRSPDPYQLTGMGSGRYRCDPGAGNGCPKLSARPPNSGATLLTGAAKGQSYMVRPWEYEQPSSHCTLQFVHWRLRAGGSRLLNPVSLRGEHLLWSPAGVLRPLLSQDASVRMWIDKLTAKGSPRCAIYQSIHAANPPWDITSPSDLV
jgi:hypothetical protein